MDAVITYVNMNDPIWYEQYKEAFNDEPNIKRFKELGTLRLQIQLIRKYMSWIEQIFVVVSSRSQVPDLDDVTIVTHDQIIPEECLPTFNSCTIELFLYKIPNLSEYFIYFNDDIFPINYIDEKEFFDTKPILSFKTINDPPMNIYHHQCKNSSNLARVLAGLAPSASYTKTDHICTTHKKSVYDSIWKRAEKTLKNSITKKREKKNINQYLFTDYLLYTNQCKIQGLNYKYVQYSAISPDALYNMITDKQYSFICIQDDVADRRYDECLMDGLMDNLSTK